MNPFEILKDVFQPFTDGEKKPLNAGEVMNLWFFLTASESTLHNETVFHNLAESRELREKLLDVAENVHKPIIHEIKDFLMKEGVPLPEPAVEKPRIAEPHNVPEAYRQTDKEIANLLVFNLVEGVQFATRGLTESVRADVGAMFAKYMMMKVTFSLTLKPVMEKNGWLKTPPYFPSK